MSQAGDYQTGIEHLHAAKSYWLKLVQFAQGEVALSGLEYGNLLSIARLCEYGYLYCLEVVAFAGDYQVDRHEEFALKQEIDELTIRFQTCHKEVQSCLS